MFEDNIAKSMDKEAAPKRLNVKPTSPPFLPTPYRPNQTMSKTRNFAKRTKRKFWGRKMKSHRKKIKSYKTKTKSNEYIKKNSFLRSQTEKTKKKELQSLKFAKPEKLSKEQELPHIENTLYALVQNELLFQDNIL